MTGCVSEEELAAIYESVKIVVVPLRAGAGVKGKVIDALSKGCPVVTTSIGAEGIAGIEKVAVIKDSSEDFADAVVDLYQNDDKLKKLSNAGVAFIKENFSLESSWNIIKDDFR